MRIFLLAGALFVASCGYHAGTKADLVPKNIRSIAIPAFSNSTTRYKLNDALPEAIAREFLSRTRYRIESNEKTADAVLRGNVSNIQIFPTLFDTATGRASGVQVNVTMSVTLYERATGKVIWTRPSFEAKNRYEISVRPETFFEESDAALARLSREVARSVVSAILENF